MTVVEKSEMSPHLEEFQMFHMLDVKKSEIYPHDRCEETETCFVAKSVLTQFTQKVLCQLSVSVGNDPKNTPLSHSH